MLLRASGIESEVGFLSVAEYAGRLRAAGIAVEWDVVEGKDATSAILETARSWKPDFIVMATTKRSALDRWLNGSVTEAIIRSAPVPVLVVPPDWERALVGEQSERSPLQQNGSPVRMFAPEWEPLVVPAQPARILVPLDGSALAEEALLLAIRLAELLRMEIIVLRAINDREAGAYGANEYVRRIGMRIRLALPGRQISLRVGTELPVAAILDAAHEFDVDVIAMSTRGHSGITRAVLGSTATGVLEQATVPLLLLGPHALHQPTTAQIRLRAPVRTLDNQHVGEVHRVVVDLEQRAIVSVVVLGRGPLARDVLIPIDCVEASEDKQVSLRLTSEQLDELPDFSYNDFVTPPPSTWTSFVSWPQGPMLVPVSQRKRLGPGQQDITPGTRVRAGDGEIGPVDRVEIDGTGQLEAFWVRADGLFATDIRLPAEWVRRTDEQGNLLVAGARADIEAYLGHESRARL